MARLTERQRRFAEHYIELGNMTRAAEAAGFQASYAHSALAQPAVQEYLEELRKNLPVNRREITNFLTNVMRGNVKADKLRTEAAYQMGRRAGLWRSHKQYEKMIKEAAFNE